MAKKPILSTLWAERGAKEEVDSSKIAVGWTAERPPFQWENWSQWRQDSFLAHLNVRGLPEWDNQSAYGAGIRSYVSGSDGEIYVSTAPSGGTYPPSDPTSLTTKWKKAWLDSDGTIGIPKVVGLQAALNTKVDKVAGKALSDNNYDNVEKGKLATIEMNAQRNVPTNLTSSRNTSTISIISSTGEGTNIPPASRSLAGAMLASDKVKVDSLPSGENGVIPLTGGGTGASNSSGARLSLQLGNHVTNNYGTTANTVMMGNDQRLLGVVEGLPLKADRNTRISVGTGLRGGGDLSSDRSISLEFGNTASTVARGDDSRLNNGQSAYERLNIGTTAASARAALGLGSAALLDKGDIAPVGTTYIQFPNKATPASLYGGVWALQYNTEGIFFRTEGGNASGFQAGIQGDMFGTHSHAPSMGNAGAHAHSRGTMNITGSMGLREMISGVASSGAFSTSNQWTPNTHRVRGEGYNSTVNFDASRTWTGSTSSAGDHSHSISIGSSGGVETRPRNRTVRVWLRTS